MYHGEMEPGLEREILVKTKMERVDREERRGEERRGED